MIKPSNAYPFLLFAASLALACGDSTRPAEPEDTRRELDLQQSVQALKRQQLLAQDRRLEESFTCIAAGMTPDEVRQIMRVEPEVPYEGHWEFPLSEASDTGEELGRRLQVVFEGGVVSRTGETFTGVVTEPVFDR